MIKTISLICVGASLGALCRYGLSTAFNSCFSSIALGTLAANLLGGYLIGLALGFAEFSSWFDTTLKLFFVTGFLGAFTTFSAFSAETVIFFQEQRFFAAGLTVLLHVMGSLTLTFLGFYTCSAIRNWSA